MQKAAGLLINKMEAQSESQSSPAAEVEWQAARTGSCKTSGSAAELGHLGGREVEGRRRLVEEEDAEAPRNREAVRVVEVHDAPPPPCRGGRSGAAGARVKSRQPRAAPSKSSACAG